MAAGPIFVIAPPRSGMPLVSEALRCSPDVRIERPGLGEAIDRMPGLRASDRGWDSDRLTAADAIPGVVATLRELATRGGDTRLLDRSPRNAIRVSFLSAVFPEAAFIYLHRPPEQSLPSLVAAWEAGDAVTHPDLPGWDGPPWALQLVPGWRRLSGRPLSEIAATQWVKSAEILLADLEHLPAPRWCIVEHDVLRRNRESEAERIFGFLGLDWDEDTANRVRGLVPGASSRPADIAAHADKLDRILPRTAQARAEAEDWLARSPDARGGHRGSVHPFSVSYDYGFAAALRESGGTLVVTTRKTNRIVVVRGEAMRLDVELGEIPRPGAVAADSGRLAMISGTDLCQWRTTTGTAPGRFGLVSQRTIGTAGTVDIALAGTDVWLASAALSCLATVAGDGSLEPRWTPPFISGVAAEDRCRLNGISMINGEPALVTTLDRTDTPAGWRDGSGREGCLIDVRASAVILGDLNLPHSPRESDGRFFLLESGEGALCAVDAEAGTRETVAQVPGFARGLAISGQTAFVGVSAVTGGDRFRLPVADRVAEPLSGVCAIDVSTGVIRGTLRFTGVIAKVAGLALIPGVSTARVEEPPIPVQAPAKRGS